MTLPSQEYLISRIDYDPQTGEARWKPVDESYGSEWKRFNTKHAGKMLPKSPKVGDNRYQIGKLIYKLATNKDVSRVVYINNDSSDNRLVNITDSSTKLANTVDAKFIANYLPVVEELLSYNHVTGILTWLERDDKNFNVQHAGKTAGCLTGVGYNTVRIYNKGYKAHRLAWYLYYGCDPFIYQIDHIDGNKSNNSISNLRLANNSFNIQQTYKHTGVGVQRKYGKWRAQIGLRGVAKHIGMFDTEVEAQAAYEAALLKYKPVYSFTPTEQAMLDELYNCYPNCDPNLQKQCHQLQVKALNHYIDAAVT